MVHLVAALMVVVGVVSANFDLAAVFEWVAALALAGYPWVPYVDEMTMMQKALASESESEGKKISKVGE